MMTGRVKRAREAIVPIRVAALRGQARVIRAVVDTGFTEFLALRADQIASLALPGRGTQSARLADATPVDLRVYRAFVEWHGRQVRVPVLELEGGPIIGMALLHACRLSMDVIPGGEVRIRPLRAKARRRPPSGSAGGEGGPSGTRSRLRP